MIIRIFKIFSNSLYLISVILLIIFVLYNWLNFYINAPGPLKNDVILDIKRGTSKKELKLKLREKEIISNNYSLDIVEIITKKTFLPKAGEYKIKKQTTPIELFKILNNGKVYQRRILIKEGMRSIDIINTINNEKFLESTIQIIPKEGTIFPDTYNFVKGEDRNALLERMQTKMKEKLLEIWKNRNNNLPYKSPYELIIMASIIEKETGIASEREIISSVFINRLNKKMRLQSDPTVIYGKYFGKENLNNIESRDIKNKNPWNTYQIRGLPETAICNPGEASIRAAAMPAKTNFFYFVSNGKGKHNFSSTLKEHNKNVRKLKEIIMLKKND